ncbi:hypothetical protein [Aquimarina sp. I32.4]|uniref:hypothetical protein n=1 Tax=Aquimarina sp. I32.4 TaxID=2053903 RepID=UPI000CDEAD63|nr:hypothetical protein [Aquimarina sp. I32.4]
MVLFADHTGISHRQFSLSLGASPGYLNRIVSQKSNVGGDYIEKCIEVYPDLNPLWLVTGEGKMLKSDEEKSIDKIIDEKIEQKLNIQDNNEVMLLIRTIIEKELQGLRSKENLSDKKL